MHREEGIGVHQPHSTRAHCVLHDHKRRDKPDHGQTVSGSIQCDYENEHSISHVMPVVLAGVLAGAGGQHRHRLICWTG